MGEVLETEIFSYPVLGHVMTETKHDMLTKFLKMKPPTFVGFI